MLAIKELKIRKLQFEELVFGEEVLTPVIIKKMKKDKTFKDQRIIPSKAVHIANSPKVTILAGGQTSGLLTVANSTISNLT